MRSNTSIGSNASDVFLWNSNIEWVCEWGVCEWLSEWHRNVKEFWRKFSKKWEVPCNGRKLVSQIGIYIFFILESFLTTTKMHFLRGPYVETYVCRQFTWRYAINNVFDYQSSRTVRMLRHIFLQPKVQQAGSYIYMKRYPLTLCVNSFFTFFV